MMDQNQTSTNMQGQPAVASQPVGGGVSATPVAGDTKPTATTSANPTPASPGVGSANATTSDGKIPVVANTPVRSEKTPKAIAQGKAAQADMLKTIIEKIRSSENILVALPNDPTVDDIAAAIGLTLFLDSIQRHVTAIYSGQNPNSLAFLQPEETFETNTDSLQDFVVSLSKEKADHLRYKLEGDFVKVYITPYRTNITEDDLTFSHGEYNVDFVIALDVSSVDELDNALAEHGRIMHNASTVNITIKAPGKFAEVDWSNPMASSVCEMVTQLIFEMQGEDKPLDKDVATALLTGIVAATDRFSNSRTNSDTLALASKLMGMGADQQLISSNVTGNEIAQEEEEDAPNDNLVVGHSEEELTPTPTVVMPDAPSGAVSAGDVVMPTVNTDISQINPSAVNDPGSFTIPSMSSVVTGTVDPGTGSQTAEPGTTANPAAQLAGDFQAPMGPDPAMMTIPDMVPPMDGGSSQLANTDQSGQGMILPPAPALNPTSSETNNSEMSLPVMPESEPMGVIAGDESIAMNQGVEPAVAAGGINGQLADRPDSILPPPPAPPVAEMSGLPPAP